MKKKILVIEDEKSMNYLICTVLTANQYDAIPAYSGQEACTMLQAYRPDLIILDLGLPDMNGVDIIRRFRRQSQTPIVVVSARTREQDKIEALDLGADDYITKPFSGGELLARIRTALRHAQAYAPSPALGYSETYHAGELEIDYDKRLVTLRGTPVHLTQSEYKIVSLLSRYSGKVLTYDFLLREIWGAKVSDNTQNLRAVLAKIRRKLEKNPAKPEYIFTEVGVGYRMRESESTP